jgi:hypothetical protein
MSARVRIDLAQGILEAEGTEEFLLEIYRDFRDRLSESLKVPLDTRDESDDDEEEEGKDRTEARVKESRAAPRARERRSGKSRTPVLVKNLDLATKNGRIGLKDFVAQYRELKTAQERIAVSVYYLAKFASLPAITMDHVYTCLKHMEGRLPDLLDQALWDSARRKGWIDTSSLDDIKLPLAGENWVEHDLEKANSPKA